MFFFSSSLLLVYICMVHPSYSKQKEQGMQKGNIERKGQSQQAKKRESEQRKRRIEKNKLSLYFLGALLTATLVDFIYKQFIEYKPVVFCWSDSQVVLGTNFQKVSRRKKTKLFILLQHLFYLNQGQKIYLANAYFHNLLFFNTSFKGYVKQAYENYQLSVLHFSSHSWCVSIPRW